MRMYFGDRGEPTRYSITIPGRAQGKLDLLWFLMTNKNFLGIFENCEVITSKKDKYLLFQLSAISFQLSRS